MFEIWWQSPLHHLLPSLMMLSILSMHLPCLPKPSAPSSSSSSSSYNESHTAILPSCNWSAGGRSDRSRIIAFCLVLIFNYRGDILSERILQFFHSLLGRLFCWMMIIIMRLWFWWLWRWSFCICRLQDIGRRAKRRIFVQEYIEVLRHQKNGRQAVFAFIKR